MNFMIYIQKKEKSDCNGIEKYVKEQIEQKKTDFIPHRKATAIINNQKK